MDKKKTALIICVFVMILIILFPAQGYLMRFIYVIITFAILAFVAYYIIKKLK
ncbi:hypothetical protein [Fructilactobacillus lindneri]|uniref:hypothetical protein n=1 Tax=Fructilactobacillus lindneri TaxID=53444 RepID=UPI0009CABC1C|nr:hypothetical protein [Fructilactobacillus lindneri]SJZ84852.1 hypothetical protein SAMN02746042_00527 [Fructilactobacillus lindneri DSM 20690 = JCM 11027]